MPTLDWIGKDKIVSHHQEVPVHEFLHQYGFTVDGKQREADDYIVGLYAKNKVDIARDKGFVNPFMIRYAYELFDGTYTYISVPMPMFPSV